MPRKPALLILCLLLPIVSLAADFYEVYKAAIRFEKAGEFMKARAGFLDAAALHPQPQIAPNPNDVGTFGHYDPYAHLTYCEISLGLYEDAANHLQMSRDAGITPPIFTDRLDKMLQLRKAVERRPFPRLRRHEEMPRMDPPIVTTLEPTAPAPHSSSPQLHPVEQPAEQKATTPPAPEPETPPSPSEQKSAGGPAGSTEAPSEPSSAAQTPSEKSGVDKEETRQSRARMLSRWKGLLGVLALIVISIAAVLFARKQKQNDIMTSRSANTLVEQGVVTSANAGRSREDTPTEVLREEDMLSEGGRKRHATPTGVTPPAIPIEEALALAKPLPEGRRRDFGDYQLEGVLGSGGMGTTYLATRRRDGWTLAVKVPHEHLMSNEDFVRRFIREGALGTLLHHPNIVRIFESDRVNGRPFIAMELLKGQTLQEVLKDHGVMSVLETLEIAREIALALDYASLKGVVHRDLKPENIMLPDRGGLKVMDFGIARLLNHPGTTVSDYYLGTPTYSAPEASGMGGTDHRADLYSLGIILYRMLSGQVPFYSQDPVAILEMHRKEPLPPFPPQANVPGNISAMIGKLAAKDPNDRYQTAESLLVDLNDILRKMTKGDE
jgi:serine/threonine-protein kinase